MFSLYSTQVFASSGAEGSEDIMYVDEGKEKDEDEVEYDEDGVKGEGTKGGRPGDGARPAAGGCGLKARTACGERERERRKPMLEDLQRRPE